MTEDFKVPDWIGALSSDEQERAITRMREAQHALTKAPAPPNPLYSPLGPVEVGEWLLYENSYQDREFVQVERLTPKHIVLADGPEQFSRAHGAQWSPPAMYDAYLGRVRKLTPEEQAERAAQPAKA